MRPSTPFRVRLCALALLVPGAAAAQSATTAAFTGAARIGTMTRTVTMRLSCALDRGKINNLAVEMDIPDAENLKTAFDVLPFEGPGALNAKMHLTATAPGGSAQADLGSTGSFGNNGLPAESFTFSAALTPQTPVALQKLQAVSATLSAGASQLTWRIENPAKGRPAIDAVAALTGQDAARVRDATARCRAK